MRNRSCLILAVGLLPAALAACGPADPPPPWDAAEMIRALNADLRTYRKLPADFNEALVLAWRIDTRPPSPVGPPIPVPGGPGFITVPSERRELALVWARARTDEGSSTWTIVQGWRNPAGDEFWQRTVFHRHLSVPLTHLRPGEAADGTWYGYHRFDKPPTVEHACAFAAVDFLSGDRLWRREAGALLIRNWQRAFDAAPACRFPDEADVSSR